MKKLRCLQFLLLAAFMVLLSSCASQQVRKSSEKNWVWVHANEGKSLAEWQKDFEQYRNSGINAILIGSNKKVVERVVPVAHKLGLEVHVWMWTLNRAGDTVAMKHPDWFSVNRLGKSCYDNPPYVDYYRWVCPTIPEVQEHILNQVKDLLSVEGVDGIHLDYVRYSDAILPKGLWPKYGIVQDKVYPEWDYGYNPSNIKLFEAKYGYSPLSLEDPGKDTAWVNFRLNTVTELVNKIAALVHSKHKMLTAAVFPSPKMASEMVYQQWNKWNLDAAMPMIYHNFYEENIGWIGATTNACVEQTNHKIPIYTGLFLPDLQGEKLDEAMRISVKSGAKGCAFFDDNSFLMRKNSNQTK